MASQLINSSFTLRPSTSNRDRPELTLRQTEVSRIPRETKVTSHCGKWGRAFKRQRLFMDRSLPATDHSHYASTDQYISEDEYDTPIIRRRVSCEFPSRHRVCPGSNIHEHNYWKTRCMGMQTYCDDSRNRLLEAEEDQRQLRQRIRALEEQLLLQSGSSVSSDEGIDETSNRGNVAEKLDVDINHNQHKKRAPPAIVIEIKENHQAVSSCFYMTDGEGLNESYDLEMEDEEDQSMNVAYGDDLLGDIEDDRNDINIHQQRRG